jgi:glutathione S-transferase
MSLVHLVIALALVEFFAFCWAVGRARVRYNVPAPATTGNATFECYFRVQMNTLEQLVIFVPSMVMFAHYWGPTVAAALGALFIIGRAIYFYGYTRAPERRHMGFLVSSVPNLALLIGSVLGVIHALWQHGL